MLGLFSNIKCSNLEGWGPWSYLREPDFTPCFEQSLSLIPNLALIIFGIPIIKYLSNNVAIRGDSLGLHFFSKMVSSILLIGASLAMYGFQNVESLPNEEGFDIASISAGFQVAAMFVAALLTLYSHKSIIYSSTTLLLFWPLSIAQQALQLRTLLYTEQHIFNPEFFWFFVINIGLSVIMLIIEAYPKKLYSDYMGLDEDIDISPEEQANVYSFITFSWLSSLLELGAKKPLVAEDLWNLPKAYQVAPVSEKFQIAWGQQCNSSLDPSIIRALLHGFGGPFLFAALLKGFQDVLGFIQPTLLSQLITFISSYNGSETPQPMYYGFAISFGMLATAVIQTMFLHQYFQLCMATGMKLRVALVTAIYQKSLRLSSASGQTSTVGEIVNHMSVDAQRLQDLCSYVHVAWSGLFQICVALYLLYRQVGPSVFAGFGLMVIAIPVNFLIGKKLRGFQQIILKVRDSRIKLVDELLSGMKVIKLYAWEKTFLKRLFHIRNDQELATLRKYAVMNAASTFTSASLPLFVSFVTFAVYAFINDKPLTAETVFVTLSLLNMLSFPLNMLPYVLTSVVEAAVSVKRIHGFLTAEELDPRAVNRLAHPTDLSTPSIEIYSGTFSWNSSSHPSISNVDLKIKQGELFGVVGRVGSGKSSFISSVLGDMNKIEGEVTVRGSVAFVPQQPWIMNATVRENIVFGNRFDQEYYDLTIQACALKPDLDMLISGDQTEIGERGINLSGGQKARISLARAVYSRADIFLLDDPLSAVDAHVGRHIFDQVIGPNGLLSLKTRVLVTHAVHLLESLDRIAMIERGMIGELGSYPQLKLNPKSKIHDLISAKAYQQSSNHPSTGDIMLDEEPSSDILGRSLSRRSVISHHEPNESNHDTEVGSEMRRDSSHVSVSTPVNNNKVKKADKLITVEESAQGSVDMGVYIAYFQACSIWGIVLYLFLAFASQLTALAGMLWLKRWSEVASKSDVLFNIIIYGLIGLGSGFVTFFQFYVLYTVCGLRAAKSAHDKMALSVVRAPMNFFDTTPLGRIVNRFSKDQSTLDEMLPRSFGGYVATLMRVVFVVLVISFSTPPFLAIVLILGFVYIFIQRYYLATSRELKRLDSVSRSPIYAHFQETLGGATSIRAYMQQTRFIMENEDRLEANLRAYYPSVSLNRWLAVRLEFLGSIIIFSAATLAVLTIKWGIPIAPAVVGLSVTYALNVTQSLNWCIRMYCEIETNIVSMERIKEYMELSPEAPYEANPQEDLPMNGLDDASNVSKVLDAWPQQGKLEFKNYSTKYREGLDLVLRNLTLTIRPGEKVGIVGRTGAGKSSLTLALFRIIEATHGSILVDDIPINKLALFDLRSRLSIIPQDPVLFAGKVRDNLDPFNSLPDSDLWVALEHANLKEHVQNMEGKLDATVSQGGDNFSVGQRQLICLARALLRKSKILILDEATAAIDYQTDNLIQNTIRVSFKHCTVLTIAHRINTVMDGDKILVLDKGQLKEFDSPKLLLNRPDSLFYGLAKEAGLTKS